jgi:hypothetical protein
LLIPALVAAFGRGSVKPAGRVGPDNPAAGALKRKTAQPDGPRAA